MVEGVWEKGVRKQKVSEKHLCSGQRLKEMYLKKKKRCVAWGVGEELSHFSKTWQGREIQRNLMDA